ncbi:MAG: Crp/Fnr family transcriptional regulator [Caldilineae bacterium]|nr:MAG: Crp/Fnr family transcriptional regulator [Caldilineae bacterium]
MKLSSGFQRNVTAAVYNKSGPMNDYPLMTPSISGRSAADAWRSGEKWQLLANLDLFRALSNRELAQLARSMTLTSAPKGKIFYHMEEKGEILYLVNSGRVQLYRISSEGKKLVLATLGGGAMFGEDVMWGEGRYHSEAQALTDCTLFLIHRHDLRRIIYRYPQIGWELLRVTHDRLKETESRLEEMAFKSVTSRVAATLLRQANGSGDEVRLTHQDLAEMTGTYRETTTLVLNELKSHGLIRLGRRRIRILNYEGLKSVAERAGQRRG